MSKTRITIDEILEARKHSLYVLKRSKEMLKMYEGTAINLVKSYIESNETILLLTQELIDSELLKEKE